MEEVKMTPEQLKEFKAFQMEKKRKEEAERQRAERETYKKMVNDMVNDSFPRVQMASEMLASLKGGILEAFNTAIELKSELFNVKDEQRSHTFSNDEGTKRITIGFYTIDAYKDTVNEGIQIVKESATALITNNETKALVEGILRLLSKDQNGNLKPSRVMQMRQMANELNNQRLLEGITIIEESHYFQISKSYVKAELKDKNNAWVSVPLGITES